MCIDRKLSKTTAVFMQKDKLASQKTWPSAESK